MTTVSVPALQEHMRRAKTSEATTEHGAGDAQGVQAPVGLSIDNEVE